MIQSLSHTKSTFHDGKCIVYLQFLDLILQYSEIQQFTISSQIEKLLIFTRKKCDLSIEYQCVTGVIFRCNM